MYESKRSCFLIQLVPGPVKMSFIPYAGEAPAQHMGINFPAQKRTFINEVSTMEKSNTDEWPKIKEPTGGLAEITTRKRAQNKKEICIDGTHFCDVVEEADGRYVVYKEPKKRIIRAKVQDLIRILE